MKAGSQPALQAFLESPVGAKLANADEVRGFVFAVAGAPDLIPPSEWLPEAFNGETPEFESAEQAQAILGELMDLYNAAASGGRRVRRQAPGFLSETMANLDEDAAARRWSRGFDRGFKWASAAWRERLPRALEEELASILLVLTFFSSRQMAEACRDETANGKSLEQVAEIMRGAFDKAMVEYVRLGQSIYRVGVEQDRAAAAGRSTTGRNEPCPCGSGRKYKKCCGAPS